MIINIIVYQGLKQEYEDYLNTLEKTQIMLVKVMHQQKKIYIFLLMILEKKKKEMNCLDIQICVQMV